MYLSVSLFGWLFLFISQKNLLELYHLANKFDSSLEGSTLARTNTDNTIAQA